MNARTKKKRIKDYFLSVFFHQLSVNSVGWKSGILWTTRMRLLTLTSIYIWQVRDICFERVYVANTSVALYNENHGTVNDVHIIRQLNRLPLTKTIRSKSANLIVCHTHKICIFNLSGNLSDVERVFFSFFLFSFTPVCIVWMSFIHYWQRKFWVQQTANTFQGIIENNMEIDGNARAILPILMTDYINKRSHSNDSYILENSTIVF